MGREVFLQLAAEVLQSLQQGEHDASGDHGRGESNQTGLEPPGAVRLMPPGAPLASASAAPSRKEEGEEEEKKQQQDPEHHGSGPAAADWRSNTRSRSYNGYFCQGVFPPPALPAGPLTALPA